MLYAALNYGSAHPDITARQDALLLGIYTMMRTITHTLCPQEERLPEIKPLGIGWILDIVAAHDFDLEMIRHYKENA